MRHEIKPLTGFRGILALMVAIYHFGSATDPAAPSRFHLPKGYLAVDGFLILSAFVLSYNYGALFTRAMSIQTWVDFLARRIARLYPAYYGVLLLTVVKLLVTEPRYVTGLSAWGWIGNLTMATGWGLPFLALVGTSWSASTELVCYLCFPFAVRAVGSGWVAPLALLTAAFLGLVAYADQAQGFNGALDLPRANGGMFPLLRAGCGFAIGLVVFRAYADAAMIRLVPADALLASTAALLAVALWRNNDLLAVAALAGLILALSLESRAAKILCASPPIMFLGQVSYSLYLVHPLLAGSLNRHEAYLVALLGPHMSLWTALAIYLAACLVVSYVLYRVFERGGKALVMAIYPRPSVKRKGL